MDIGIKLTLKMHSRDFPGSSVVKTVTFQCRGWGIDPWSVSCDPIYLSANKQ